MQLLPPANSIAAAAVPRRLRLGLMLLTTFAPASATVFGGQPDAAAQRRAAKKIIGPVATVEETESNLAFKARVDTGARTTSVHVEQWKIEDEADRMADNVGKTIRFRIENRRGECEWLERRIVESDQIKTSESAEQRYKVRMTLRYGDVKKRVLVSLNDRSHMNYPVLLGRNFLRGDFIVDVDLKPSRKPKADSGGTAKEGKPADTPAN